MFIFNSINCLWTFYIYLFYWENKEIMESDEEKSKESAPKEVVTFKSLVK